MILFACNKSESSSSEALKKVEAVSDISKLDHLPVAPNCESATNKEVIQKCAFQHISNHIASNFKYPDLAQQIGMEGRIMVSFVVNTDGSIDDVEIAQIMISDANESKNGEVAQEKDPRYTADLEVASEQAEMEALELVKTIPTFDSGAVQNGELVRLKMVVPIQLKLS